MTLTTAVTCRLRTAGLDPADTERAIRAALEEDLRYGPDVTSAATAPPGTRATAEVVARAPGVLAGLPVALAVLDAAGIPAGVAGEPGAAGELGLPGSWRRTGTRSRRAPRCCGSRPRCGNCSAPNGPCSTSSPTCPASPPPPGPGPTRWPGPGAAVRDTRKTLPGLRQLEKYAVRCGGGLNHRMGLGDAALIKDNHVAAAGGVAPAIKAVRAAAPGLPLEVECDDLDQVQEALDAGAGLILLDNMGLAALGAAVGLARRYPSVKLEASGGLTLATARAVAETGVDYVAVGALTHSSAALDLGLDLL